MGRSAAGPASSPAPAARAPAERERGRWREAGGVLAALLPAAIDHLTPHGQVPESNDLESALGGLFSGLMK
jgi:hypothetical protein